MGSTAVEALICIGGATVSGAVSSGSGGLATTGTISGNLAVLNYQPASTADPGSNVLGAINTPKAWGLLYNDGLGGVSILDGYAVASVAAAGSNQGWTVTLAHAMLSTNYSVTATYTIISGLGDNVNCWVPKVVITGVSGFDVLLQKSTDASYVDVSSATLYGVSIHVFGRQLVV